MALPACWFSEEGVKVRIVTRGPKNQGILKDTSIKAIESILRTKINIDLRKDKYDLNFSLSKLANELTKSSAFESISLLNNDSIVMSKRFNKL